MMQPRISSTQRSERNKLHYKKPRMHTKKPARLLRSKVCFRKKLNKESWTIPRPRASPKMSSQMLAVTLILSHLSMEPKVKMQLSHLSTMSRILSHLSMDPMSFRFYPTSKSIMWKFQTHYLQYWRKSRAKTPLPLTMTIRQMT